MVVLRPNVTFCHASLGEVLNEQGSPTICSLCTSRDPEMAFTAGQWMTEVSSLRLLITPCSQTDLVAYSAREAQMSHRQKRLPDPYPIPQARTAPCTASTASNGSRVRRTAATFSSTRTRTALRTHALCFPITAPATLVSRWTLARSSKYLALLHHTLPPPPGHPRCFAIALH